MFCGNTPIVHLIIDAQDRFLDDLSVKRNLYFSAYLQDRADQLRSIGIPTLWVAYRDAFKTPKNRIDHLFSSGTSFITTVGNVEVHPFDAVLKDSLGLLDVHADDLVYVKKDNSAFAREKVSLFLQSQGCKNVLVSGMNTHACVAATIRGGLMADFNMYPLVDCLADKNMNPDEPFRGDPHWHIQTLNDFVWGNDGLPELWKPLLSRCLIESLKKDMSDPVAALMTTPIETLPEGYAIKHCGRGGRLRPVTATMNTLFW